jgi:hypothetical protein
MRSLSSRVRPGAWAGAQTGDDYGEYKRPDLNYSIEPACLSGLAHRRNFSTQRLCPRAATAAVGALRRAKRYNGAQISRAERSPD